MIVDEQTDSYRMQKIATEMNFPRYPLTKIDITRNFKEIIGFEPVEIYSSSYNWKIAIAHTEDDILKAAPNFEIMKAKGLGSLMITAKSNTKNFDFVVRCFVPMLGINEDPVTGSAHCALTPLWAEKLGKQELNSLQLSKRTGKLRVKLINFLSWGMIYYFPMRTEPVYNH